MKIRKGGALGACGSWLFVCRGEGGPGHLVCLIHSPTVIRHQDWSHIIDEFHSHLPVCLDGPAQTRLRLPESQILEPSQCSSNRGQKILLTAAKGRDSPLLWQSAAQPLL